MLPRWGGVLDQPSGEMLRIEKMLEVFAERDELEARKSKARSKTQEKDT